MKKSFFTFLWLIPVLLQGQSHVDSLRSLLEKKSLNTVERIDALNELAYQLRSSEPAFTFKYLHEANALAKKTGYKKGEGIASAALSNYHWSKSEPDKSLAYALSSLQIFESIGYEKGLMDSYMMLSMSYSRLRDTEKAIDYVNRSLSLAQKIKNNEGIARAYNYLGVIVTNLRKKAKEGFDLYSKALSYLPSNNTSSVKTAILGNMGIYYRTYAPDKALPKFNEALAIAKSQNNKSNEAFIRLNMGLTYTQGKEYAKAEEHLIASQKLAEQIGDKSRLQEVYFSLIELKILTLDGMAAHEYHEKYSMIRDSIFKAEKAQQIAELETRYETEKKEQTIKLLEQEKQIQTIWRNALIGGVLLSVAATFLYISRARKAKQLLEIQQLLNDKLKDVDKLKSSFFANISHEFRTPLTLILAPLEEELKKRASSETEPLRLMKRNANRLLELVNQLLDLSKLEAGKMELHVEQRNIESFLRIITASFDSWAQHKQIHFVKNIVAFEKPTWYDQDKIEKIITNLLANAFKFTPVDGTVTFSATFKDKEEKDILILKVMDTGKGIPAEEQEQVFSVFYQARQTMEGNEGGTGLGLSLVKELVKLCGGTITLQSAVGIGTSFVVELPISKEAFSEEQLTEVSPSISAAFAKDDYKYADEDVQEHEPVMIGKDSVLIVEDNADLRNFISSILDTHFTVFTANDGEAALELALHIVPSLILTDLMMPGMDGMQLTERIKTDERTSHIPVILLTARNEQQSRLEGLKTGADDYLTKPFSTEELLVRITNLIEQRKRLAERFRELIIVPVTSAAELSLDDKFIQKVRGAVEAHIDDSSFSVEKLAEEIHLTRTQLLRKLKALTGFSPNDFIKDLRLKKAADLISQKADTITQVGYAVGFNDQSYFTKCFKKQFGMTPTEFSAQVDRKKEVAASQKI